MKLLGLFLICTLFWSACLARISTRSSRRQREKNQMLETNKIPVRREPVEIEDNEIEDTVDQNELPSTNLSPCDDCKAVVRKVDAVIKNPAKLAELKAVLELVCNMVGSSYRDECKEIVQNIDSVARELEPLLSNPEVFCREIHLCGNNRESRVLQFFLLFVKKYVYQVDDPEGASDVLCDECVVVIGEAKTLIEDKSIQDEIKQGLKSVCNMMGSLKDECDNLVDEFFPTLLQELETLLKDPRGLCRDLGLCNTVRMAIDGVPLTNSRTRIGYTSDGVLTRFQFLFSRLHTKNGMNVGCIMCKFGIGTVVDSIKDNPRILNKIAQSLEIVCDILPQQGVKPECLDFLRMYLKPVLVLTLEEINSRQICQDFHLCSEHELRKIFQNQNNLSWKNEVVCDSCKTLADFLKFECRRRSFQEALANEAKQICDLVPSTYATQCDNLVDQYVPYVVQLLVQELNPSTICPELHMCPPRIDEETEDEDLQEIEVEE